jgi:hypothetical protein
MAAARNETSHASAARSATNNGPTLTVPPDADGVIVTVDITANPGGADTIQPILQSLDPTSGKFTDYATFTALTAATSATFQKVLAAAAVANPGGTNVEGKIGPVPQQFRIRIVHSAGTSFTYSVGVAYC